MAEVGPGALLRSVHGGADPEEAIRNAVDALVADVEVGGPPAPLDMLGSFRGVVDVRRIPMDRSGLLRPTGDGHYVIEVNETEWPGRQQFSIAHEICHTFFHEARALVLQGGGVPASFSTTEASEQEEEWLCDVGAGHMLMHPDWLERHARGMRPSLDALFELTTLFDTSAEAMAFQLTRLGIWRCSVTFWEWAYRAGEQHVVESAPRRQPGTLPGQKLRAVKVYPHPQSPYLPRNKSIEADSSVAAALDQAGQVHAVEEFVLGDRTLVASCESQYAGYPNSAGEQVPRVITLMRWRY